MDPIEKISDAIAEFQKIPWYGVPNENIEVFPHGSGDPVLATVAASFSA